MEAVSPSLLVCSSEQYIVALLTPQLLHLPILMLIYPQQNKQLAEMYKVQNRPHMVALFLVHCHQRSP